jgi:hypothetical protein
LSLIIRERWEPFGRDPIKLIWASELSENGRKLLADSAEPGRFAAQLQSALRDIPHDAPLQAELIFGSRTAPAWLAVGSYDPSELTALAEAPIRSDASRHAFDSPSSGLAAAGLWQAIADASRVLRENARADFPSVFVSWLQSGTGPTMWCRLASSNVESVDKWGNDAYVDAIEKLSRTPAEDYLEKPLEDRAQGAWQALGLQPLTARYVARNGRSMSAQAVGQQCARHLELLEKLAASAIASDDLERAGRWIVLLERVASVFEKSVHSPSVYNYVQTKHNSASSLAQLVQGHQACSRELATQMAAVVATCQAPTPRPDVQSDATVTTFYFENAARSSLRTSALTLMAAVFGAIHLRARRNQAGSVSLLGAPAASELVACAALLLVCATFIGLEATNGLGERAASSFHALVLFAILLGSIAWLGWLVIVELVRDPDSQRQSLRRRIAWLIGCMVILAAMRPLIGRAKRGAPMFEWRQTLESSASEADLSASVRLFLGAALATIALSYASLRWRRMRREPQISAAIHPLVIGSIALWLSLWIALGPPGVWLRRQSVSGNFSGQWSAVMETVDLVSALFLQGPVSGNPSFNRGWNLLTFSVAARMINFGLWLVLLCHVLWFVAIHPPRWARRRFDAGRSNQSEPDTASAWLSGAAWSCLWIGLVTLAIHGWCTLGMGYYIHCATGQES